MSARKSSTILLSCLSLAVVAGQAEAKNKQHHHRHHGSTSIELKLKGVAEMSEGVAEISAFDPKSKRLFIVDGSSTLKIVDLSDPGSPTELPGEAIDVGADILADTGVAAGNANSIAVKRGLLAVAVAADPVTDDGFVAFYDTDGTYKYSCRAGALPDMVTFTPNGKTVLVANEGEPDDGIDPAGSVSVINVRKVKRGGNCGAPYSVRTAGFERFDGYEDALRDKGVRIFPGNSVSADVEPEYIAVSDNSRYAWVTLQEANSMALVSVRHARILKILPLGLKDHALAGNGLDASDKDDAINIQTWPVFGMYMPDSIASFSSRGRTYLVTANEGDDRGEDERIEDIDLDPTAFPDAGDLQDEEALGRLGVSSVDGDTDGDGDYDKLFSYGARSFTIWDGYGRKVHDSGDFIGQKTAELVPALFNADDGDPDEFDNRSDAKGAEPEGATTGEAYGRTYAFIGLERGPGGVMVFDVKKPWSPEFVQYVRRDEDVSPEGLLFIDAKDSPSRKPLLVVSHEVSGTLTVYGIEQTGGKKWKKSKKKN